MSIVATVRRWFRRAPAVAAAAAVSVTPAARVQGALEPHGRSFTEWTPVAIRSAALQADNGNLQRVADLCDWILGDDRAPTIFATRRGALLAARLTFDPAGHRGRSPMVVRALEAEADWWELFPEEELGRLLTWGWLLGVGLGEMVPPDAPSANGRYVPTLKVWHPRNLRWDWATRQWYVRTETGEIKITPGDGRWVLFMPYGASRPWAQGLWRGMSRLVLFKQEAISDWALHSEVHGQPMRVVSTPAGTDKSVRQALANDLAQIGRDTTIALPGGVELKLLEAVAQTWEMFQAQIELVNRSLAVAGIGTNLPTEVVGAAGTGASAQHLVRQDYKRSDSETLSTTLRTQVLVHWAQWNFGDANLAPWPKWDVEPPQDAQAVATVWATVATAVASFITSGMEIAPEDIQQRFGIPVKAAPKPPPVAPPAPAPNAAPPQPAAQAAAQDN